MITIPIEELEDRRIYLIRSRNLMVGVWSEQERGFIGIREKFGYRYLFTEYEVTTSPTSGTAWATAPTDTIVPPEISLSEVIRDSDGRLMNNEQLFALLAPHDEAEHERWLNEQEKK